MGARFSCTEPKTIVSKFYPALVSGLPSMAGKVVVITGTTSGTGLACAKACIGKGAKVLALNRPSERATKALEDLTAAAGAGGTAIAIPCDLTSFASVRGAAEQVVAECSATGVDVLCNNAGIMATEDEATIDGCDMQMQVNHLSHFLLTRELWPLLQRAADVKGEARVVNHSSAARKGPRLKAENLGMNGGKLGGDKAGMAPFTGPRWDRYQQTKLANAVFTYAINDRAKQKGSKVISLWAHPGVSATELFVKATAIGSLSGMVSNAAVAQSAEDGSCGITICCCKQGVQADQFYGPAGIGRAGEAVLLPEEKLADSSSRALLWDESEKSTGAKFEI